MLRYSRFRRIPFFPIIPVVPVALLVANILATRGLARRLARLESRVG
jgi:hypothetical protein